MEEHRCKNLLASLSDYVDGSLSENLCTEIERHMAGCENCRLVVDSLRKTIYLYRVTTEPVAVPDDVRQRLFSRLDLDDFLKKNP